MRAQADCKRVLKCAMLLLNAGATIRESCSEPATTPSVAHAVSLVPIGYQKAAGFCALDSSETENSSGPS